MTSLERNLFDKLSKSSESNLASLRDRRYDPTIMSAQFTIKKLLIRTYHASQREHELQSWCHKQPGCSEVRANAS